MMTAVKKTGAGKRKTLDDALDQTSGSSTNGPGKSIGETTDWIHEHKKDIQDLDMSKRFPEFLASLFDKGSETAHKFEKIMAPLDDGSLDPGDLDAITGAWMREFETEEIRMAKEEIRIQNKLAGLYQLLASASEDDWREYTRIRVRARFDERIFRLFCRLEGNDIQREAGADQPTSSGLRQDFDQKINEYRAQREAGTDQPTSSGSKQDFDQKIYEYREQREAGTE